MIAQLQDQLRSHHHYLQHSGYCTARDILSPATFVQQDMYFCPSQLQGRMCLDFSCVNRKRTFFLLDYEYLGLFQHMWGGIFTVTICQVLSCHCHADCNRRDREGGLNRLPAAAAAPGPVSSTRLQPPCPGRQWHPGGRAGCGRGGQGARLFAAGGHPSRRC